MFEDRRYAAKAGKDGGGDGCDGIATYENRKKNELRNI